MDIYCRYCSAKLEIKLANGRNQSVCSACGFIVKRNPAAVAIMVVQHDGHLLLVQRRVAPLKGFWSPPGGHIEWNESAEVAAVRETWEETGVQVRCTGLLDVFSQADVGIIIVAFCGERISGKVAAGDDAVDAGYFDLKRPLPQPTHHEGTLLDRWYLSVLQTIWQRMTLEKSGCR